VDMNGVRVPTMTTTLNEGNIQRVEKRYDRAGSLDVSTTLTNTGVTGATAPIKSYGYTVLNGTNNVTRTFPATRPTTALTTPVDADDLFPFTDGYQFYNGTCGANDPTKYSLAASTLASLGAGSTNVPVSAKEPVQRFLYQKNGAAQVSKPFHVAATQRTSITVGSTTYTCVADRFEYTGVTSSTGTLGVPLPFGDYTVCVDDAAGGNNNTKVTLASAVQVRALNPTQQTLNITSGTKGAAC
jgi:hypothetical protein